MFRFATMLIFFLLSLSSQNIRAQESMSPDSSILNQLIKQAETLADTQLDSALILNRQISIEAAKANLDQLVWESRYEESDLLNKLGHKDSALIILDDLKREAEALSDSTRQIKALTRIASIEQLSYDFKPAIANLLEAQKFLTRSTPFDLRFNLINTLGQTHRKMKDYDSALKYYQILEHDFFYQLSTRQKYLVYMNNGNVFADQKDYAKTEEYFQKAYQECIQLNEPEQLAQLTYNLGALYYRQQRYKEASSYSNEALEAYVEIGDQLRIERCYRVLGAIQYDQGNYSVANQFYLKALEIAQKINNPKSVLGNYKNLYLSNYLKAKSEKDTVAYRESIVYASRLMNLKDSLYQTDLTNQLLELEKKYETEKKNAEIDLLSKENQLQADELLLERQRQQFMWMAIGLLTLVVSVVIYFMFYYRKVSAMLQRQSRLIFDQKEQITSQNVQLQKAVNTQNKLFSIIAHDLRSPLVSVSNFVQLLNFYLRDGRYEDITRMAKDMDRKNEQVLELTDNLLHWAQSQSGGLKPQLQRINLNEILDECYELYLPVAEQKGIKLDLNNDGNCLLWADRDMVRTICRNLINNALKFTHQEGKVVIAYCYNDTEARVSISDTGLGISPGQLKRLFSLDQDDVRYGTDGEKSSGLGLSVCKEFCDIMRGKIEVSSTEGLGSTFSFTLPKYSDELQELAAVKAQQAAAQSDL
ncbi:ATP-binding protein [Mangrovibacterium lignilyticum]|uniref:ATP-binding protein n=1 Tax=Mangrovibacterium lignilyticum TaxID=2668052 RepID=UPI0013D0D5D0|nr:tetratricopeptide repeat-containing sensor histidine kinase [Mangrovibacterium lignilyticum]